MPLGCWPTPVEELPRLGDAYGVGLWVKRDDRSATRYGGNKVRKLELLLAAAQAEGADRLLTTGGIGSNQVLATAIHGHAALGLATAAVVVPQPLTTDVRQKVEVMRELGVELLPTSSRPSVPAALWRAKRQGTYVIGPGGSSPLGTVGYLVAAFELAEQIAARQLPCPDVIVVPLGSGGTLAGLWLGLTATGLPCRLVGVRVVERVLCNGWLVKLLARRCRALCREHGLPLPPPSTAMLTIDHAQAGATYGQPTAAARVACERAAELGGLRLESTYTGKALAALPGLVRRTVATTSPLRVLFWNTHNSLPLPRSTETSRLSSLPRAIERWLSAPDTPEP